MIKADPIRVPIHLREGRNTHKPEMKQCIKIQDVVIKELIPGGKHLSQLIEEAQIKAEHREEIRYENEELMFGKGLDKWDSNEVL